MTPRTCEGWLFEQVWEDLEQNFFPTMRAGGPCMEGLSPAAKSRLFERRMAWLLAGGVEQPLLPLRPPDGPRRLRDGWN